MGGNGWGVGSLDSPRLDKWDSVKNLVQRNKSSGMQLACVLKENLFVHTCRSFSGHNTPSWLRGAPGTQTHMAAAHRKLLHRYGMNSVN